MSELLSLRFLSTLSVWSELIFSHHLVSVGSVMMSSLSFLVLCSFFCLWSVWLEVYEFYCSSQRIWIFLFYWFFISFLGGIKPFYWGALGGRSKSWEDNDIWRPSLSHLPTPQLLKGWFFISCPNFISLVYVYLYFLLLILVLICTSSFLW